MSKRPPSWTLRDCVNAHLEHPVTFWAPSAQQTDELKPGDFVKLIFNRRKPKTGPLAINSERMWVEIVVRRGNEFQGKLNNDPVIFHRSLKDGSPITFTNRNIADFMTPEQIAWRKSQ